MRSSIDNSLAAGNTPLDDAERSYFKRLPTSFVLEPEEVDKLKDAARRILTKSREFQRLLKDLRQN